MAKANPSAARMHPARGASQAPRKIVKKPKQPAVKDQSRDNGMPSPDVSDDDMPDGYKTLPEELHDQPALQGRKTMRGVAIPVIKDESEDSASDDNSDDFVAADAEHVDNFLEEQRAEYDRITNGKRYKTRARAPMSKSKKVPAHIAMTPDPGSDSDPDIKAPGWNVPVLNSRKKATADMVSDNDDNERLRKKKKIGVTKAAPKNVGQDSTKVATKVQSRAINTPKAPQPRAKGISHGATMVD